jgi:hypothetical protein
LRPGTAEIPLSGKFRFLVDQPKTPPERKRNACWLCSGRHTVSYDRFPGAAAPADSVFQLKDSGGGSEGGNLVVRGCFPAAKYFGREKMTSQKPWGGCGGCL